MWDSGFSVALCSWLGVRRWSPNQWDGPKSCALSPHQWDGPKSCASSPHQWDGPKSCASSPHQWDFPKSCASSPHQWDGPKSCASSPHQWDGPKSCASSPHQWDGPKSCASSPHQWDGPKSCASSPHQWDFPKSCASSPHQWDGPKSCASSPHQWDGPKSCASAAADRKPNSAFFVWLFPCPVTYLLTYLLASAHRSQWSIGHQRPPAIALCSGLLLSPEPVGPLLFQLCFSVSPPTVARPTSLPLPLRVPGQGLACGAVRWLPEGVSDPAPLPPQYLIGHCVQSQQ